MKKNLLAAVAAASLCLAMPVFAQNVAVVNGKPVPKARVDALASQISKSGRPVTPDMEGQIKEEVIAREVFMQEAQKRGLEGTDDYRQQIELARQAILIRSLFADQEKKSPITDAEIKAEYDKFVGANAGKEFKTRHILVADEATAKKLIADIKKGAKFEELAKKNSKDPGSGAQGGDLDWGNPNSYVPEFSQAMVKLGKGQMTQEPVKSQFGYHIIRVDDVREAQLPKFEDIKPQIAQSLQQQRLAKFQQDLRQAAKVE